MSASPIKYDYDYYERMLGPLLIGPLPHRRVGYLWSPDTSKPGVYDRVLADVGYEIQWAVNPKEKTR